MHLQWALSTSQGFPKREITSESWLRWGENGGRGAEGIRAFGHILNFETEWWLLLEKGCHRRQSQPQMAGKEVMYTSNSDSSTLQVEVPLNMNILF